MQSLLARIFLSFWLIIAITIGIAALGGYYYSERTRQAIESFEISDTVLEASTALESNGRAGLESWLTGLPSKYPVIVFVVDQENVDILGRDIPSRIARVLRRFSQHRSARRGHSREPPNLRPARPLTQLVGPNGEVYTLLVLPKRSVYGEWIDARTRPLLLVLALIVSAAVSYALARAITRPVHKFRAATVAIAEGHLDTRVAESMGKRHDEIGLLAQDFDSMADKLQRASERQVELSRNISHELRSPLARMRVALELARRQTGDSSEFNRIEAEAERLDSLIGQILNYSRLEARSTEAPAIIKLAELVQDIVDNVRFECRSDGLEDISVQFTPGVEINFQGFAVALGSAIENVLRNAVHHSVRGDEVSVTLNQDERHAIITIEDNGCGVPADELERIFDPFYRASTTVADSGKNGSGLGLAIARRAIQVNAGSIQARQSANGGLLVEIRLPLAPENS